MIARRNKEHRKILSVTNKCFGETNEQQTKQVVWLRVVTLSDVFKEVVTLS